MSNAQQSVVVGQGGPSRMSERRRRRRASVAAVHARRADVQGLRAFAVVAVVVEHVSGAPVGGFVGVDVFFVISGFIITQLMLREHARTGRVSLGAFYLRRAKRILPLLVVVVAVTLVALRLVTTTQRFEGAAVDAGWAGVFLANWHFAEQSTDYFSADGPVSPFQHLWSLSVEEQFYAVWPLIVIGLLALPWRRRTVTTTAVAALSAIVVVSWVWGWTESAADPTRAYFSTPARAWELGIGALIAFAAGRLGRLPRAVGMAWSWIGLAAVVLAFAWTSPDAAPFPVPGATLAVLGTAVVIASGCARGAPGTLLLTNRAAGVVGTLSYSIYLWHFPVLVVVAALSDAVWPVYLLTALLATATHLIVERPGMSLPVLGPAGGVTRPWRRWRNTHRIDFRWGSAVAVVACAVIVVGFASVRFRPVDLPDLPAAAAAPTPSPEASGDAAPEPSAALAALQADVSEALTATSWPDLDPSPDSAIPGGEHLGCGDSKAPLPVEECTFGAADAPRTVMLVGDSTAVHELDAMIGVVESAPDPWKLVNRAAFACSFVDLEIGNDVREACRAHREETLAQIERLRPDVLVVTNTAEPMPSAEHDGDIAAGEWRAAFERYLDRVDPSVGQIVHVSPPPAGKSIQECYGPTTSPSQCVSAIGANWTTRARVVQEIASAREQQWVDVSTMVCAAGACPAFVGTVPVRKDFVHFSGAFQQRLSEPMREALVNVLGTTDGAAQR